MQQVAINNHVKPRETIEYKTKTSSKVLSMDIPSNLEGSWIMEVTSLEVYSTVYDKSNKNKTCQIQLQNGQIKHLPG